MIRTIPIGLLLGLQLLGGCVTVNSDRIMASALAAVLPEFAGAEPDFPVGFSPQPGTTRWLSASQIALAASRAGVKAGPAVSVCVERTAAFLDPTAIQNELVASLERAGFSSAKVRVVDYSRGPVAEGTLRFELSGIQRSGATNSFGAELLWRGSLVHGGGKSTPIWARVLMETRTQVCRAARDLSAGEVLTEDDVRLESEIVIPNRRMKATDKAALLGKALRRALPAGAEIHSALLSEMRGVYRGERVLASVKIGSAEVSIEAIAESTGKVGDRIVLLNPTSSTKFKAIVTGRKTVSVETENSNE